jgi:hypothetical protein
MPLSMGHPDYVYRPWSEERRRRASEAGKERWRRKREAAAMTEQASAADPAAQTGKERHIGALTTAAKLLAWKAAKVRCNDANKAEAILLAAAHCIILMREYESGAEKW